MNQHFGWKCFCDGVLKPDSAGEMGILEERFVTFKERESFICDNGMLKRPLKCFWN